MGSLAVSGLEMDSLAVVTFLMLNRLIGDRAICNRLGVLWLSPIGASLCATEALS